MPEVGDLEQVWDDMVLRGRRDEVMIASAARRRQMKRRQTSDFAGAAGDEFDGEVVLQAENDAVEHVEDGPEGEEVAGTTMVGSDSRSGQGAQGARGAVAGAQEHALRKETEEQRQKREAVEARLKKMRTERRLKGMVKGTEVKQVHPAVAALLDNPDDLGNKAKWVPARNAFTAPASGPGNGGVCEGNMVEAASRGGEGQDGGGASSMDAVERGKGGKAERRLRAQLRGEDSGWAARAREEGEDEDWAHLLKSLHGLGGSLEAEIDREADQSNYLEMRRQVEDQVLFPDEVDTPLNVTVQRRYCKYSAVGDIEKHVWDETVDLPVEYKKIFHFQNLRRTFRRATWEAEQLHRTQAASPGQFVRLHLVNVSRAQAQAVSDMLVRGVPVVVSGMLRHENKRGVLHTSLQRHVSLTDDQIIKGKQTLVFDMGFRRVSARPVYSNALGTPKVGQVKYLMQRFLLPSASPTTASLLSPLVYPGTPALAFRASDLQLVATGFAESMDADRIVLKRVTLTGYPFRIHKRMVVVRWLFFFASDAEALRRAKVMTKFGLDGEIIGPLGLHGLVRCQFGDHITHKDTVCLHLYKRVFPKSVLGGS